MIAVPCPECGVHTEVIMNAEGAKFLTCPHPKCMWTSAMRIEPPSPDYLRGKREGLQKACEAVCHRCELGQQPVMENRLWRHTTRNDHVFLKCLASPIRDLMTGD